jgi:hypothetical protein
MKNIVYLVLAFIVLVGITILAISKFHADQKSGGSLYFVYQDSIPNLRAAVVLPGPAAQWGVENPYKYANQSIIKSPRVFVKAAFQNIETPTLYGLVRVVYDLQGVPCFKMFTNLAQLDGLRLQTYSSTTSDTIQGGQGYAFEYYQDQKNLLVGSKVVCDDTYGLELMVVAPDQATYSSTVQGILQNSQLSIPGTPLGAVRQH